MLCDRWRYYLQPLLQKKFGLKGGVILLGCVWAVWLSLIHISCLVLFLFGFFLSVPEFIIMQFGNREMCIRDRGVVIHWGQDSLIFCDIYVPRQAW